MVSPLRRYPRHISFTSFTEGLGSLGGGGEGRPWELVVGRDSVCGSVPVCYQPPGKATCGPGVSAAPLMAAAQCPAGSHCLPLALCCQRQDVHLLLKGVWFSTFSLTFLWVTFSLRDFHRPVSHALSGYSPLFFPTLLGLVPFFSSILWPCRCPLWKRREVLAS